jgi:ERCC4-related helicase
VGKGDADGAAPAERARLTPGQLAELKREMAELREFYALARSIIKNSKGEVLLTALRRGFEAASRAQAAQGTPALQPKAVILTESRRTQTYLFQLLQQMEFAGKVMLFNGTNNDPMSKAIYQRWLERHAGTDRVSRSPSADMRAALVDYFLDEAAILIATEAAAEGINLQFCNLVVNYDLPWTLSASSNVSAAATARPEIRRRGGELPQQDQRRRPARVRAAGPEVPDL